MTPETLKNDSYRLQQSRFGAERSQPRSLRLPTLLLSCRSEKHQGCWRICGWYADGTSSAKSGEDGEDSQSKGLQHEKTNTHWMMPLFLVGGQARSAQVEDCRKPIGWDRLKMWRNPKKMRMIYNGKSDQNGLQGKSMIQKRHPKGSKGTSNSDCSSFCIKISANLP